MDILKKAYSSPEQCSINENTIIIQGKEYDGMQIIEFNTKKTKDYNLKSLIFFLLNRNASLKEYLSLCKKSNASPISYVDKASILDEIESYKSIEIKGFFIDPYSLNEGVFEIPDMKKRDTIVVPSSLLSRIHVGNIERLLLDGIFEDKSVEPLSQDIKEINLNGNDFKVIKNGKNIDWNEVTAIFIDDSNLDESKEMLNHCEKDISVFTLTDEKFKSMKLEISNGKLKNKESVIKSILK